MERRRFALGKVKKNSKLNTGFCHGVGEHRRTSVEIGGARELRRTKKILNRAVFCIVRVDFFLYLVCDNSAGNMQGFYDVFHGNYRTCGESV